MTSYTFTGQLVPNDTDPGVDPGTHTHDGTYAPLDHDHGAHGHPEFLTTLPEHSHPADAHEHTTVPTHTHPPDGHSHAGLTLPNMQLYLAGCRVDVLNPTTLLVQPGTFAAANGSAIHRIPVEIAIDLTVHGAGGRDTATPYASGDEVFVYLLAAPDGAVTAVASRAYFYGDVEVPAGHGLLRKLPVGYVYDVTRWGGLPNHHLSGWPAPTVHLTNFETGAAYAALTAGTSSAWAAVDLSPWIPDNARMAYVQYKVGAVGTAGSAYIRSVSGSAGKLLASATPLAVDAVDRFGFTWQRVTSTRALEYKVTGGATLSLYVAGYAQTEHS